VAAAPAPLLRAQSSPSLVLPYESRVAQVGPVGDAASFQEDCREYDKGKPPAHATARGYSVALGSRPFPPYLCHEIPCIVYDHLTYTSRIR